MPVELLCKPNGKYLMDDTVAPYSFVTNEVEGNDSQIDITYQPNSINVKISLLSLFMNILFQTSNQY